MALIEHHTKYKISFSFKHCWKIPKLTDRNVPVENIYKKFRKDGNYWIHNIPGSMTMQQAKGWWPMCPKEAEHRWQSLVEPRRAIYWPNVWSGPKKRWLCLIKRPQGLSLGESCASITFKNRTNLLYQRKESSLIKVKRKTKTLYFELWLVNNYVGKRFFERKDQPVTHA